MSTNKTKSYNEFMSNSQDYQKPIQIKNTGNVDNGSKPKEDSKLSKINVNKQYESAVNKLKFSKNTLSYKDFMTTNKELQQAKKLMNKSETDKASSSKENQNLSNLSGKHTKEMNSYNKPGEMKKKENNVKSVQNSQDNMYQNIKSKDNEKEFKGISDKSFGKPFKND